MRLTLNQRPEAIAEARTKARLTKTALADAVGRSLSLISEIEGGTRNAQPDLLLKIASVFGVPVVRLAQHEQLQSIADALGVPVEQLGDRDPAEGETSEAAPRRVPELRDEERAEPEDVPELQRRHVDREAS